VPINSPRFELSDGDDPEDIEIEDDPTPSLPINSFEKWDITKKMGNDAVTKHDEKFKSN